MATWMPVFGVVTFVLLAIFFANGVVNVYLTGAKKSHHLFLAHESLFKVVAALVGLAVGAILKYGVGLSAAQWEHVIFIACIVAGLGALAIFVFNKSLIAKARTNVAGRRGPLLADILGATWCGARISHLPRLSLAWSGSCYLSIHLGKRPWLL